jgi:hypothetical protein
MLRLLPRRLKSNPKSEVRWPTLNELRINALRIRRREPCIKKSVGFLDGLAELVFQHFQRRTKLAHQNFDLDRNERGDISPVLLIKSLITDQVYCVRDFLGN